VDNKQRNKGTSGIGFLHTKGSFPFSQKKLQRKRGHSPELKLKGEMNSFAFQNEIQAATLV
jgi:hypothetical protein